MNAHESSEHLDSPFPPYAAPESLQRAPVSIGKRVVSREADGGSVLAEIFTMTIGTEIIELLPYKNWIQLDTFKWRTRGILTRTPPGLEITWNQLKFADQTVSPWDPKACGQLEQAFNTWLTREREAVDPAKAKAPAPAVQANHAPADEDVVHFKLDLSNAEQPKLKCLEGEQTIKTVALNQQGLNALIELGLMRKPKTMKVGALHNWVELDGQMFHFKEDSNQASQLEQALNARYIVGYEPGAPPDVAIFPNPASPTGFDIQFPATPTGVVENRKRHLNEETVQLLQDQEKCRVLRKIITAKFVPPNLIFKVKTPDGGENYLEPGADNTVEVTGEDGQTKRIDLSQPISLLNLGVNELMAVFNHPAISRSARLAAKSKSSSASLEAA